MYREPNTSAEIQDFLAVSALYLGIGTDVEVACSDRAIAPVFGHMGVNRVPQRDGATEQRYA